MSAHSGILIIRLSSLGDILHALPAFAELRAAHPDAKIDWIVAKKCRFLMSAIPGIDTVHVLDTPEVLHFPPDIHSWRRLLDSIRNLRRKRYDFSIDFQGLLKTAFLGFLAGAKTRLGFSRELVREYPAHWFYHRTLARPREPVHVIQLNCRLAELTGAIPATASCDLIAPEEDVQFVDSLLSKARLTDFVIINPGGGWPTKRWSLEKFGDLAKKIKSELDLPVVVTTGPGEEVYYRAIMERCGSGFSLHFPVSFLQLIPLFKKARLVIGGDTGPFHLACALGRPVVGIFGPTSPVRNGPWRKRDEAITHELKCSYCYGRTCETGNECMNISVDEVFSAVARRLASTGDTKHAEQ